MAAKIIIIDHGTGFLKAGPLGWNQPQLTLPSIVNYVPCQENPGPSYARRRVSLGIDPHHPDTFSYPIERGRVINWEGVEHIWTIVMAHYREDEDCAVVLTEFPVKEPETRRKTLEIMFEQLDVPSLLLADPLEMSLYASGLLNGVVVDSGYSLTRVQPFLQGQALLGGRRVLEFAGEDLSTYLFKSLFKDESDKHNIFQMELVSLMQRKKCYVPGSLQEALDLRKSPRRGSGEDSTYRLPDGRPVDLAPAEHVAPEMFFRPQEFGLQGPGIPQAVADSILSCELSKQPLLLSHVVPCGGNTMYPGFARRLSHELNSSHFPGKASVWEGRQRHVSVWLGASVVAHLSSHRSQWVARQGYLESMRL